MKKSLSIILTLVIIISLILSVVSADTSNKFKDLAINGKPHWATDVINKLTSLGIITGYPDGSYKPNGSITKGEFVKLLVQALKLDLTERKSFDDISNHWAKRYIETAVSEHIIYPEEVGKSFRPDDPITRLDAARMMGRALKLEPFKYWQPQHYPFIDNNDQLVNRLFFEYILQGSVGKDSMRYFNPQSNTTRAETAVIIDRVNQYVTDKTAFKKEQRTKLLAGLIKATPDQEFEKFINSEESKKYASTDWFKAENGMLIFKETGGWDYGEQIAQSSTYKEVNKVAYEAVKMLLQYAKRDGYYVTCRFAAGGGDPAIIINYSDICLNGDVQAINSNFDVMIELVPQDEFTGQKQRVFDWQVAKLFDGSDGSVTSIEDLAKINYTQEKFTKPLQELFKIVYGNSTGQKFYDYSIKELRYEFTNPLGQERENHSYITIDGIEVKNNNGKGNEIHFSTQLRK